MSNLINSTTSSLSNNNVTNLFYISVDGSRKRFPDEAKGHPAFTGRSAASLIQFLEANVTGYSTDKFHTSIVYVAGDGSKKTISNFNSNSSFPESNQPLVISTSNKKQSGNADKINPDTLTYNELRALVKKLDLGKGLSSSPKRNDLIKVIENYYTAQAPSKEVVKAEQITVKKAIKENKEIPATTVVTPEDINKSITEVITEKVVKSFSELLLQVQEELKIASETRISIYKTLIHSLLDKNTLSKEEIKAIENLKEANRAQITKENLTSDLLRETTDYVLEVYAEEVPNTEVSTEEVFNSILQETHNNAVEDAYINEMLAAANESSDEDDENEE